MPRHIVTRTAARTAAAAALTLTGVTLSIGAAHAATADSCATGLTAGTATSVLTTGCGTYTDTGAPYTLFISQYYYVNVPIVPGIPPDTIDNVTITCQGFGPAAGYPSGEYQATGCTSPLF